MSITVRNKGGKIVHATISAEPHSVEFLQSILESFKYEGVSEVEIAVDYFYLGCEQKRIVDNDKVRKIISDFKIEKVAKELGKSIKKENDFNVALTICDTFLNFSHGSVYQDMCYQIRDRIILSLFHLKENI